LTPHAIDASDALMLISLLMSHLPLPLFDGFFLSCLLFCSFSSLPPCFSASRRYAIYALPTRLSPPLMPLSFATLRPSSSRYLR